MATTAARKKIAKKNLKVKTISPHVEKKLNKIYEYEYIPEEDDIGR